MMKNDKGAGQGSPALTRRAVLSGTAATAVFLPQKARALFDAEGKIAASPNLAEMAVRFPPLYPEFPVALEVLAQTGTTVEVGEGANGRRRIVPITGGSFRGRGLSGVVIPGGADRQLFRADGVRELEAIYELQADDGTVLMVHNRVLVDAERPPSGEERYARSVVRVEAPQGPHDWLNRRILLGTLHSLRPAQPFVFLRFYIVE